MIDDIASAPERGPASPMDPETRRRVLRRFPYVIFYRATADVVTIAAVAHMKRMPGYWRGR